MITALIWKDLAANAAWKLAHPGVPTIVPLGEPGSEFYNEDTMVASGRVKSTTSWPDTDLEEIFAANNGQSFEDGGVEIRKGDGWDGPLGYPFPPEEL